MVKGKLTENQWNNSKGCGAGTSGACHALGMGADGMTCLWESNPDVALQAAMKLSWRINKDSSDDKAYCPLGVLDNSKIDSSTK